VPDDEKGFPTKKNKDHPQERGGCVTKNTPFRFRNGQKEFIFLR